MVEFFLNKKKNYKINEWIIMILFIINEREVPFIKSDQTFVSDLLATTTRAIIRID